MKPLTFLAQFLRATAPLIIGATLGWCFAEGLKYVQTIEKRITALEVAAQKK